MYQPYTALTPQHYATGRTPRPSTGAASSIASGRSPAALHRQPFVLPKQTWVAAPDADLAAGVAAGAASAGPSGSASKPPVQLPEAERSARLQQLYDRTFQWRRACEERYARERQERDAAALEGCTFMPTVDAASQLIVQVGGCASWPAGRLRFVGPCVASTCAPRGDTGGRHAAVRGRGRGRSEVGCCWLGEGRALRGPCAAPTEGC